MFLLHKWGKSCDFSGDGNVVMFYREKACCVTQGMRVLPLCAEEVWE